MLKALRPKVRATTIPNRPASDGTIKSLILHAARFGSARVRGRRVSTKVDRCSQSAVRESLKYSARAVDQRRKFPNPGVYLEVVPNEKLVFTDACTSAWQPSEKPFFTGVITFEDAGPGETKYTARLAHLDFPRRLHSNGRARIVNYQRAFERPEEAPVYGEYLACCAQCCSRAGHGWRCFFL